ncbi:hypothetical protein BLA60_21365 [Actinophytocola xinjiangensis]|uniref:DUF397 domain-containing protein n=1 Tax=Actinophytocola xinjiangensis TaxID=485602 RepID=A0A7Z0WK29_9PSEU|nr:DUF397 domain-containing protein [Actinophytocola xinjiangensis]OLF09126.1 hypothetical protein BLA60_21365 [Actinophytocola xinjiangensis]
MIEQVRWRKSDRSGAQSNCVEVSHNLDAVRDSKCPDGLLNVDVGTLLESVRNGRFDH